MVHYARESSANPDGSFKAFLLLNPQLVNGGLFLHYYSKKLMLQTADARTQVLLPDVRPLPSLLSAVDASPGRAVEDLVQPAAPLTDDDWLERFRCRTLPSWGHEARLRLIWILLRQHERREAVRRIFDELKALEGEGHHATLTYFWVAIVTQCSAKAADAATYADFWTRPTSVGLRNPDLTAKHYSERLLASDRARMEFVPPDVKPLPSVV